VWQHDKKKGEMENVCGSRIGRTKIRKERKG
jgi:hypothetical protein